MTSVLVADSKYQFVPPHEGRLWRRLLERLTPHYLNRKHGFTKIEVRGDVTINDAHALFVFGRGLGNHCGRQGKEHK